jgi:TonB family protein
MSLRFTTIFSFLLVAGSAAAQPAPDPSALLQRAREVVLQPGGRAEAESLLVQATAIWEKKQSRSPDYAEALDLLVMTINPTFAKNKEVLDARVEPLARKALELRQQDNEAKSADLALALELEALVLEELGRIDDSRDPKSKARALRDQIIIAMQLPEDGARPPDHLGNPGIRPPLLISRAEPERTFAARVLQLQPEVMAEIVIGSSGVVTHVEMYKPAGFGLDENAAAAIMKWRFKAAERDGMPIPVEGNLKMRFLP